MSRRAASRMTRNKNSPVEEFTPSSPHELKPTEFSLEASSAKAVQLAADFTDWEKSPLEMTRAEHGVWRIMVPLAVGNYSYRFIVDGQWHDDPHCDYHIPNPFGTTNATRKVM
jgi:1,4-alpha-glucan branching enzyme